ncbi:MAG: DUF4162 domain-containing protein, partial [Anaerolineales bacterium]|nr:DUF4162 domain-containing protein [Anaerolineales bacterium]
GASVQVFHALPGVRSVVHRSGDARDTLEFVLERDQVLSAVINTMESRQIRLLHLDKREPTLEDVFVDLVGRSMEEVEHAEPS